MRSLKQKDSSPDCFSSLLRGSRRLLLSPIQGHNDLCFFRTYGNIGDRLINAGARQLLRSIQYHEVDIRFAGALRGDTAIVGGGGGWCKPWHDMPLLVRAVERNFRNVIIFPSSFDPRESSVRAWLKHTKARIFVREPKSLELISDYCSAILALDTAFFFDFRPYRRAGSGILQVFRTDREKSITGLPDRNEDISVTAADLDHWLHSIAQCAEVRTDRAHVMIAAAMLGKRVAFVESSYHKLRSIADYALKTYEVKHTPDMTWKPWPDS
jgi:exopolysaccharide biosynthesis predicted pyruvyltransferase EpsI